MSDCPEDVFVSVLEAEGVIHKDEEVRDRRGVIMCTCSNSCNCLLPCWSQLPHPSPTSLGFLPPSQDF